MKYGASLCYPACYHHHIALGPSDSGRGMNVKHCSLPTWCHTLLSRLKHRKEGDPNDHERSEICKVR
jgi:hypothetical protein